MPLLANDAYRETLEVARFERDYKVMAQAHNEIHRFMKKAMQQENVVSENLTSELAIYCRMKDIIWE